jgi:signal transduction histidine kinase/DNA-binding response OmpR family regulator
MNSKMVGQALVFLFILRFWGLCTGFDGFKPVRNYSAEEYGQHERNYAVVQDRRGIIYVGNAGALMEYDGVSWRTMHIPNYTVRSLALDSKGTVYVGGNNEIGRLSLGPDGATSYKSLTDRLKKEQRNFTSVYQVMCSRSGVWFRTKENLLRWRDGVFTEWSEKTEGVDCTMVFSWKGRTYVHQKTRGVMQVSDDDSLQPAPGCEVFKTGRLTVAVPYDKERLLLGTQFRGFFLYDGAAAVPFLTAADEYLKNNEIYKGIRLSNGHFAVAARSGGAVILDPQGRWTELYNKAYGLRDEQVKTVFQDNSGCLWLALSNGLSRVDYGSPFSIFDGRSGLRGNVITVARAKGRLFVGATGGLYVLPPRTPGAMKVFRLYGGITGNCYDLLPMGPSLLAAGGGGVYQVEESSLKVVKGETAYDLEPSRKVPGRAWVVMDNSLLSLRERNGNGQWTVEHHIHQVDQSYRSIAEDNRGNLWLGSKTSGVLRVIMPPDLEHPQLPGQVNLVRFGPDNGFYKGSVSAARAAGHIVLAHHQKGLFRFDGKNALVPDLLLGKRFTGDSRGVFRLVEDRRGHIWFHSGSQNFIARPGPGDVFTVNGTPFLTFPDTQVNAIYPEGDIVWFAGSGCLIRFDKTVRKDYRRGYETLLRRVEVMGKDGFLSLTSSPGLEYRHRNLRFQVASPFFEEESKTLYSYFMEGYSEDWSKWTRESFKEYTNLDPGNHIFRARAKNVYGIISEEGTFNFRVLPPWYLTIWAYLLYASALLLAVFFIVKWRSRRLMQEKQRLEGVVRERTAEIEQANTQLHKKTRLLEEQSEKLKQMDKIKSRFFAGISHEFRTPLTLILGPLEQMWRSSRGSLQKKNINMVYRNARRLLGLIDQLLDLARLESGKMKLQAAQGDMALLLRSIIEPFELAAAEKRLKLSLDTPIGPVPLYFDGEKMGKIMLNLLSNAIKFTPEGGAVTVFLTPYPGGYVEISVKDTGPGIPTDQLSRSLELFYQVDITSEHHHKGSGIGLALVKQLVDLHHGELTVNSRVGEDSGSEFTVRLPAGKSHLQPGELSRTGDLPSFPPAEELPFSGETGEGEAEGEGEREGEREGEEVQDKDVILVVEDSSDLRAYIRGALEPGYQVVEAKNGKDGLGKARAIIPDLIISDIMMPEADGYELCRGVKENMSTSHIPVILLTAKVSEENVLEGLETGADDYVTKPFSIPLLRARIKNLIDLRRRLQLEFKREIGFEPPMRMSLSRYDREFLSDLEAVIRENLSDPDFNVEEMSRRLYVSRATLHRKLQALCGETPTDFIRSFRLQRALQLLKNHYGSVTEVAFEVGFTSRAYFTKCFKEKFRKLPSEYLSDSDGDNGEPSA